MSQSQEEAFADRGAPDLRVREYAQQIFREVYRDSWLPDEQALRLNCLSFAVTQHKLAGKDDDLAGDTIAMAKRYVEYVMSG